jgi:hypothetical protein
MRRVLAGLVAAICLGVVTATLAVPGNAGAVNPCDSPNPPTTCDPRDPHGPSDPSGSLVQATRSPGGILVVGGSTIETGTARR